VDKNVIDATSPKGLPSAPKNVGDALKNLAGGAEKVSKAEKSSEKVFDNVVKDTDGSYGSITVDSVKNTTEHKNLKIVTGVSSCKTQRTMILPNKFIFIIGLALLGCGEREGTGDTRQRAVSYHTNGQLKHEVLLTDGKPDGIGINYFENGRVQAITYWQNGKKHGPNKVYYQNGNLHQENMFIKDVRRDITKTYWETGGLMKLTELDSLGRVIGFYFYTPDGTRDFSHEKKDPIIVSDKDTITLGETYEAEVRLGNRQYPLVDVYIGELEKDIMKNNPRLPKKDSVTSILKVKPQTVGDVEITGIVFEHDAKLDSADFVAFTLRIYVKQN